MDEITPATLILDNIKYFSFEGGSIKTVVYVGALKVLEEKLGNFSQIQGASGSSAGCIFALLVLLGYDTTEMDEILTYLDWNMFLDNTCKLTKFCNMIAKYGQNSGDNLELSVQNLLRRKAVDPDITFAEFKRKYNKDLRIAMTELQSSVPIYVSFERYGNLQISKVIRASMSLPLVFQPVRIGNALCSDSGIIDNFPIYSFGKEYKYCLGFRVDLDFEGLAKRKENIESYISGTNNTRNVKGFFSFLWSVFKSYQNSGDFLHEEISNILENKVIRIYVPDNTPTIITSLSKEEKEIFVKLGRESAEKFLTKKE